MWIEKITELVLACGCDWNTLVADFWPNDGYSRLIGHVQMKDVAIGYGTGFRVCAYLENGRIKGDSGDDMPLINKWLNIAVAGEGTNIKLHNLAQKNPFEIRLSNCGEGELNDAMNVEYK